MKLERVLGDLELTLGCLALPDGLEHLGWRARLGRSCRAGRARNPEAHIRFAVELIFEHQDLLERGSWRGALQRADGARASRELYGDIYSD